MKDPSSELMDLFVDKHISTICPCEYINDNDNHCAHFVCHVMEYSFGQTCFGLTSKGDGTKSANIRVHEVFSHCRRVGKWSAKPSEIIKGFIFITQSGNVNIAKKEMANVRKKHVGLFIGKDIWQYKNTLQHVIKQTPGEFAKHYEGTGYETFFGEFPL